jgi:hypothetical protein
MPDLELQPTARPADDLAGEVARLAALLDERKAELRALQDELREFRALYTRVVGARLAELAEIEEAIREAEARRLGLDAPGEEEDAAGGVGDTRARPVKTSLKSLFWSVAKLFHPDHAADEQEAGRRHAIMAEASRAYREGDAESLHTLLGDEGLRFYCASASTADEPEDLAARLLNLKEELRTVEFGIKRARQDALYRIKLNVEEEAARGRDALADMAERTQRRIVKARRRLEHMS